jgi:hypothetical protein
MDNPLLHQVRQLFDRQVLQHGRLAQAVQSTCLFDGEPPAMPRADPGVDAFDQTAAAPVVELPVRDPGLPANLDGA